MTVPPAPSASKALWRRAAGVCARMPAAGIRRWRQWHLRRDHRRGSERAVADEEVDERIVATGAQLRRQLLTGYERRHAAAGYRVLMLRPGSITAEIWFRDLQLCMAHAGIHCRVLEPGTPAAAINEAFEVFEPNVFIATEATATLRALDLAFIQGFKRRHGCLRLFVPVWHAGAPGAFSTLAEDGWRRALRRAGLTADAHFSIFEPEFHDRFSRDPDGPAVDYVAVPQACNPLFDYPRPGTKRYDYIMVTSMTDDRLAVSHQYLRPILARHRGLWAGPRWGFGEAGVPPSEMPQRYAESRVALSPLVAFVHRHGAELTHRVYAAAACGAFQLTMPTPVTARFFREDELIQAATPRAYARLFDHYVHRPVERNAVALAALRRVYAEHSCFHRVDKLVSHWDQWRRRGWF